MTAKRAARSVRCSKLALVQINAPKTRTLDKTITPSIKTQAAILAKFWGLGEINCMHRPEFRIQILSIAEHCVVRKVQVGPPHDVESGQYAPMLIRRWVFG